MCAYVLSLLLEISKHVESSENLLKGTSVNYLNAWKHLIIFLREFEEPALSQSKISFVLRNHMWRLTYFNVMNSEN